MLRLVISTNRDHLIVETYKRLITRACLLRIIPHLLWIVMVRLVSSTNRDHLFSCYSPHTSLPRLPEGKSGQAIGGESLGVFRLLLLFFCPQDCYAIWLDPKYRKDQGCRILASDHTLIVFNPQNEPFRLKKPPLLHFAFISP